MAWLLTGDRLPHSAVTLDMASTVPLRSRRTMSHLPGHFTAVWLAMVLAMAPPLLLREIGHLWRTSLRRLRHLTIAWFVCGYVGIWLIAGIVLSTLFGWVTVSSGRIAVAVALVVLWHCSPARQRCLNACHRLPTLRVFGTAAQLDSLRYRALNRLLLRRGVRSRHAPRIAGEGPSPHGDGGSSRDDDVRATPASKAPRLAAADVTPPISRLAESGGRHASVLASVRPVIIPAPDGLPRWRRIPWSLRRQFSSTFPADRLRRVCARAESRAEPGPARREPGVLHVGRRLVRGPRPGIGPRQLGIRARHRPHRRTANKAPMAHGRRRRQPADARGIQVRELRASRI